MIIYIEVALIGQRWDNLSFQKDNNCNWLKSIKSAFVHEFLKIVF